jgi:hypothetical protein
MPLTTTNTATTQVSSVATSNESLLVLFSELASMCVQAESDAAALMRRNELQSLVSASLVTPEALATLEADTTRELAPLSVAHSIVEAVSHRSPVALRLVALELLSAFFSLTLSGDHRARLSAVLLRMGLPRVLVDDCVCDERIDVSQAAVRLLLRWGGDPNEQVARPFFAADGQSVCEHLAARLNACSDIVQMRFFELMALLFTRSDAAAERCLASRSATSLLDAMTNTLASDDVLLKLNVVELVVQLCSSAAGVRFCEQKGVLANFVALLSGEPADALSRLYVTLVIKCVGRFASLDVFDAAGSDVNRWAFTSRLVRLVSVATDAELLTEAITALASLLVSIDKERAATIVDVVCLHVVPHVTAHNRALSAAALYGIASLTRRLGDAESFVQQRCLIDDDPLLTVLLTRTLRHNENSKTAQRCAAFTCLRAIAEQPWGVRALVNSADWLALLLSRESEVNTAGWHAKYDLVRTVEENLAHTTVDAAKTTALRSYLRQGAIFVPGSQVKPEVGVML